MAEPLNASDGLREGLNVGAADGRPVGSVDEVCNADWRAAEEVEESTREVVIEARDVHCRIQHRP